MVTGCSTCLHQRVKVIIALGGSDVHRFIRLLLKVRSARCNDAPVCGIIGARLFLSFAVSRSSFESKLIRSWQPSRRSRPDWLCESLLVQALCSRRCSRACLSSDAIHSRGLRNDTRTLNEHEQTWLLPHSKRFIT